jgi:hypothetical protein
MPCSRILSEFRCDPVLSRSLRHAFVSQLANANVSEEQRMELRHTTRDIHKLYTELKLELQKAVARLPTIATRS